MTARVRRRPPPRRSLALAALAVAACGTHDAPVASEGHATLGGENVAQVGSEAVPAALVAAVATARGRPAAEVLPGLIDDAAFAAGASMRGLADRSVVARDLRAARARFIADRIRRDAAGEGPLRDDEIAELSQAHWRDVDRPESVHVVHAVVLRPKGKDAKDPAALERARALAGQVRGAVIDAKDAEDFQARARAVAHEKLDVRVEDLPAFVENGGIVEVDGTMDATFARTAFALAAPGATSAVTETSFGYHVIRLVERLPPRKKSLDERRALFAEEGLAKRGQRRFSTLLASLRASTRVDVGEGAEASMASVAVDVGDSP